MKIDTIFMNLENRKTSKPHVLILNLTDKIYLRGGEKLILKYILSDIQDYFEYILEKIWRKY